MAQGSSHRQLTGTAMAFLIKINGTEHTRSMSTQTRRCFGSCATYPGMTGTKLLAVGSCGACTVHVAGAATRARQSALQRHRRTRNANDCARTLANAIFAATGKRLRSIPVDLARYLEVRMKQWWSIADDDRLPWPRSTAGRPRGTGFPALQWISSWQEPAKPPATRDKRWVPSSLD